LEQYALDDTQDRGVRADAERERDGRRQREPGRPKEGANGIAKICQHR
jgi:hypothetical protein